MKNLHRVDKSAYTFDKKGEIPVSDGEYFGTLHEGIDFSAFSRISDIPQFREYADENLWIIRKEFGYPRNVDVFKFLGKVYKDWFEAAAKHNLPFTQADLSAVDLPAWRQVQQKIKWEKETNPDMEKGIMPYGVYLPNEKTAALSKITDPDELRDILQEREVLARVKARQRSRKPSGP